MKVLAWLLHRKIELAVFLFGVLLRLSMYWNYHYLWSYDANLHWEVIQWIADHGKVPATEAMFESFHPPLYYSLGAWLLNRGVSHADIAWASIVSGIIRLAIIWAGLELYVRGSRVARIMALALAAVSAASIHLDGMVYPEALHCTLDALAMLLIPLAFRRSTLKRWPLALAIGLVLGLGALAKVSATTVVAAVGVCVVWEFLAFQRPLLTRIGNALPWAFMLSVCVTVCGWYYVRNVRVYGQPFITSFDIPSRGWAAADIRKQPLLDRRSLGYVFDWDPTIYQYPYAISGIGNHPRFFPVAMASTFVDFWSYRFQGYNKPWLYGSSQRRDRSITEPNVLAAARAAVTGGTVIFFATLAAWFVAAYKMLRERDAGRLALLLVPTSTLLATLNFTIKYPTDGLGVIKAIYMTFGAPPAYALFGIAAAWAQKKRHLWPIFAALVAALWLVTSYSAYCRLGLRMLPESSH